MLPPPPPPLPQEENNTSETRAIATQGLSPARPRPSALGRRGGRSARRGGGKRYSRDSVGVRQQCDDECEQQRRAAGARPERAHGARVECGRPGWRARRTAALPPSATARARAPPRPAPRPPPSIAPPRVTSENFTFVNQLLQNKNRVRAVSGGVSDVQAEKSDRSTLGSVAGASGAVTASAGPIN
ncbi:unnamed protein product [Arctia plantaginis]|uniref:Uncharacterized protein n=1 Tax=Arctia plantaginis TaxID=874455 RepID=A0A8S1ABT9_ARCPL|nr:unnamed protein product [Arctia plantaginis]